MLKELKATCFLVNIIDLMGSIGRHFVTVASKGLSKDKLENWVTRPGTPLIIPVLAPTRSCLAACPSTLPV